jgi:hypothetical protein
VRRIEFIRSDAGSQFISNEFHEYARTSGIKLGIAAPRHQEMNGVLERQWQTIQEMARTLLIGARLSMHFHYFASRHACHLWERLPIRGLTTATGEPCSPFEAAYGAKPKVADLRVFGCPVAFDRYQPSHIDNGRRRVLPTNEQIQRRTRGTHIGVPPTQKGYLVYTPNTAIGDGGIIVVYDAIFDEHFDSTIASGPSPFTGAVPERPPPLGTSLHDIPTPLADHQMGTFDDYLAVTVEEGHRPCGDIDGEETNVNFDFLHDPTENCTDAETDHEPVDEQRLIVDTRTDPSDVQAPADSGPRRSTRSTSGVPAKRLADEYALSVLTSVTGRNKDWRRMYTESTDLQETANPLHFALQAVSEMQEHPIEMYLPEPGSYRAILSLPPELRLPWIESVRSELKNLIVTNDTFLLGDQPRQGEQVIPTKLTL